MRKQIIDSFLQKIKNAKIGVDESIYVNLDKEYDELQNIEKDLKRKIGEKISEFESNTLWDEIKKKSKINGILKLTHGYSGSDIERGTKVALLKAINKEILTYDMFYQALKLVGGTAIHVERQDILSNIKQISEKTNRSGNKSMKIEGPPEI
ncbi:MAG: hypothetical protein ACFE8E_00745 [Candidatus Hodarchaeota archaeon]